MHSSSIIRNNVQRKVSPVSGIKDMLNDTGREANGRVISFSTANTRIFELQSLSITALKNTTILYKITVSR
jgi:hypothetical protein